MCEKMWAFFKLWQHFKKLTRNQKDFYIILYYIDIVGTQITAQTQKDWDIGPKGLGYRPNKSNTINL